MNKLTFACLAAAFACTFIAQAQCNLIETITICDMTQVDSDGDGVPDGLINLYDEYTNLTGNTIESGTWFDPDFNFALDESTGVLFLWDLDNASETITDYQFQLFNATCGDDIALTVNVVLGPFSGFAVPAVGVNEINVEICDIGVDPCGSTAMFDLNQALLSVPSAHGNGVWTYEGSSPSFIAINGSQFLADIPYQPGMPLVDEETFVLKYSVPGIDPCDSSVETIIKLSVIRDVFSGAANQLNICESELIAGDFDNIDLRDDEFLVNEDIEGVWLFEDDTTGQITGFGDSEVNLGEVYDELYQNNPRFGCVSYGYSYLVESRSPVCSDKTSTVGFTFFEALRPFTQIDSPAEFCCVAPLGNLNLYDLLTFTTENGVLYDYPNNSCTNWTLVSGPSDLGLVSNSGELCSIIEDPSYTSLGTISIDNLSNDLAGTYVFEYTVLPEYNCGGIVPSPEIVHETPDGCGFTSDPSAPCSAETAQVTLIIHPANYPGEDTILEFCLTDLSNPVDLISLLETNGTSQVYTGPFGSWTDLDTGSVIVSPFTLPEINDQQTFNFLYSTTTENNCNGNASLTFTVYEQYNAGIGSTINVCNDDSAFNLYDLLSGEPNTNGTWSGPNGFMSTDNNVVFDPSISDPGVYVYSVSNNGLCPDNQVSVSVGIIQNASAGSDMMAAFCQSDLQIDLLNILDNQADSGGIFIDVDNTSALNGTILDVSSLSEGFYDFEYQIQGNALCNPDVAIITIEVLDITDPIAQNQTFCLIDAATVADLVVTNNNAQTFNWYDSATSTSVLPVTTLLLNGEDYFVSAIDSDGCESSRVSLVVSLLPLNDDSCDDCQINDGISDNDDGENEVLDLCNLPIIFPDFELEIFNRYGTVVFKGNENTELFDGESNVSLTLGDRLPSGVYFYVFNPNDTAAQPFQGHFYLSR